MKILYTVLATLVVLIVVFTGAMFFLQQRASTPAVPVVTSVVQEEEELAAPTYPVSVKVEEEGVLTGINQRLIGVAADGTESQLVDIEQLNRGRFVYLAYDASNGLVYGTFVPEEEFGRDIALQANIHAIHLDDSTAVKLTAIPNVLFASYAFSPDMTRVAVVGEEGEVGSNISRNLFVIDLLQDRIAGGYMLEQGESFSVEGGMSFQSDIRWEGYQVVATAYRDGVAVREIRHPE